jgi:protein-tyrosine phosphatase
MNDEDFKILVVCVGNVCRSPLAERLLHKRFDEALGERAGSVSVSSAGSRARVGAPMESNAVAELERRGGSADGFVARPLTEVLIKESDLVLTMTKELRSRVLEEAPGALRRAFTLREFAALARKTEPDSARAIVAAAARGRSGAEVADYDVADPIGQPAEVHREVANAIAATIDPIVAAISDAWLVGHSTP